MNFDKNLVLIVFVSMMITLSAVILYLYIDGVNNKMNEYTAEINKYKNDIFYLRLSNSNLNKTIEIDNTKYNYTKKLLEQCEESKHECINDKEYLKELNKKIIAEKGVNMNPTFSEVKRFIDTDDTDEIDWTDDFDCTEFSNTLISNMINKGRMFACTTELEFGKDIGHVIVEINSSDKGLIYIEPQNDKVIYSINLGDNYCDLAGWSCNWTITSISSCFGHSP